MARHCKRFCLLFALCATLAWLARTGPARAYEEQVSLDLGINDSLLVGQSRALSGPGGEVGVGIGFAHAIVLRANLGFAELLRRLPKPDGDHVLQHESLGRLRVEGIYQLDVLKVVPFIGLGATVTSAQGSAATVPVRAGGHVVLGFDYLISRRWICGVDLRSALLADDHQLRSLTDVTLRVSRMFETF